MFHGYANVYTHEIALCTVLYVYEFVNYCYQPQYSMYNGNKRIIIIILCGRAVYCVVGRCIVCEGGVRCAMAVYCMLWRCIVW